MCLDTGEVVNEPETITAFKVFCKRDGKLISAINGNRKSYPKKWVNETKYNKDAQHIIHFQYQREGQILRRYYPTGFHACLTRDSANTFKHAPMNWNGRKRVVKKVLLKNIVARGLQDDFSMVVAKDMKVL